MVQKDRSSELIKIASGLDSPKNRSEPRVLLGFKSKKNEYYESSTNKREEIQISKKVKRFNIGRKNDPRKNQSLNEVDIRENDSEDKNQSLNIGFKKRFVDESRFEQNEEEGNNIILVLICKQYGE